MAPLISLKATIFTPISWISLAVQLPTLPNPCTAQVACFGLIPKALIASPAATITPRPVAAFLPKEPPRQIGLPVTKPGSNWPLILLNSSIIQPMILALVFISGAGISIFSPMIGAILSIKPRVKPSSSLSESLEGSTTMPPLPPP